MMSRFKVFKTKYEDTFGFLEFMSGKDGESSIMICKSSKPQLFGIEYTEELLSSYFSKYRIYGERERNFDWNKDIPEDWELVEVEIKIIEESKIDLSKIVSSEEWEELGDSESEFFRSIIEGEKIKPLELHSSFHVWEERYKIGDDIIRLIGAIGYDGSSVEKLKK